VSTLFVKSLPWRSRHSINCLVFFAISLPGLSRLHQKRARTNNFRTDNKDRNCGANSLFLSCLCNERLGGYHCHIGRTKARKSRRCHLPLLVLPLLQQFFLCSYGWLLPSQPFPSRILSARPQAGNFKALTVETEACIILTPMTTWAIQRFARASKIRASPGTPSEEQTWAIRSNTVTAFICFLEKPAGRSPMDATVPLQPQHQSRRMSSTNLGSGRKCVSTRPPFPRSWTHASDHLGSPRRQSDLSRCCVGG
jgi:hypothetical protein